MSFSKSVKQELARLKLRTKSERRAQLAGMVHTAGSLRIGSAPGVVFTSEQHEVGKQFAALASSLYDVRSTIMLRKNTRARQTIVTLTGGGAEALLTDAGLFRRTDAGVELTNTVPVALLAGETEKRAFLRGAFLGAGSVSDPKRAYHMEIVCGNEELAEGICALLLEFECAAKSVSRKDKYVVYLKEGDRIAAFLALTGASKATLDFEEARVERELRNYINRTSNCETANIGKTVVAASEQIMAIRRLFSNPAAFRRMSPALREAAEARLNHPDASLSELSELLGIGRSGVNHRLQKLMQLDREMNG